MPDNIQEFTNALRALARKTNNLRPALSSIAAFQERQLQKAFDADRSPEGEPWQALAPSTIAQKRNSKSLVETVGRIPRSRFSEVQGNKIVVGYGDPLAIIHHFGANIPERVVVPKEKKALFWAGARHPIKRAVIPATRLPARPLVGFSENDVREWTAIVEDEIAGEFD